MNSRRAANRAASARSGDSPLTFAKAESHQSMKGRRIPHREPEHHEEGGNYRHEAHSSFGSPASAGASKGPGPLPGAGELIAPGAGPGPGSRSIGQRGAAEMPISQAASTSTPKGMKIYSQE